MRQRIADPKLIHAMTPLLEGIAADLEQARDVDREHACTVELERLGGTLRSSSPVTVDFIAEVEGRIGYLAWRPGPTQVLTFRPTDMLCEVAEPAAA